MTVQLVVYAEVARAAALNDAAAVAAALDSINAEPGEVVGTLLRLHLGQLVLATLSPTSHGDHAVAVHLRDAFAQRALPRSDPTELLKAFAEIRDALADEGLPVMLLKGAVLAEKLYGGIDHRPQHDVDLLVHRQDARSAGRVVAGLGYRRLRRDGHAVTFQRGAVQIDLHHSLRSTPAYAIDEEAAWHTAREEIVAGTRMLTASDETTLTLVATSLVEDIAFGMTKMKSVCDVWLLARHIDATTDWERWFSHRAEENLEAIAVNGGALALLALNREDDAPNFMAAVDGRRGRLQVRDRAHALGLISAAKGSTENMVWMGQIYPGSLIGFRIQPFVSGLPGTLRGIRTDWVHHQVDLHRSRRALRDGR